ncbi:DUF1349 domain-containing protein [Desnuesiella massiliensis]|uniref:DUF1349 domain-containing protein n=1 Tax=Desnuesiella massiliensis TaxID=1650662 RepID=UPI0006E3AD58|nr:DUF1349 domain-containing protein [Desnuesiella massiliensis]
MENIFLFEDFSSENLSDDFQWFNEPQNWELHSHHSELLIKPEAKTDYWQETHYGFRVDNGPFLFTKIKGDFAITTKVRFNPLHQYDQAGLMIRLSSDCWLKTSVEFEPEGYSRLGAVVTNHGFSDWSTQNFLSEKNELYFRIRREAMDYIVEYSLHSDLTRKENWTQIRMARLLEDNGKDEVMCGIYCCSPIGQGYEVYFDFIMITEGRI